MAVYLFGESTHYRVRVRRFLVVTFLLFKDGCSIA